jgi:hypothetical protein
MIFGDNRLPQRFWDKVQPEPNTGCWIWAGGNGLRRPRYNGQYAYALPAEITKGPRPRGLDCSHLCHQDQCVNPDHIVYETHAQNKARDRGRPTRRRKYAELAHLPNDEYERQAKKLHDKAWQIANRDKYLARQKDYYEKNKKVKS